MIVALDLVLVLRLPGAGEHVAPGHSETRPSVEPNCAAREVPARKVS